MDSLVRHGQFRLWWTVWIFHGQCRSWWTAWPLHGLSKSLWKVWHCVGHNGRSGTAYVTLKGLAVSVMLKILAWPKSWWKVWYRLGQDGKCDKIDIIRVKNCNQKCFSKKKKNVFIFVYGGLIYTARKLNSVLTVSEGGAGVQHPLTKARLRTLYKN